MSLGRPRHGARFGVSVECQSIGTSGKKQRACYLAQKLSVGPYFEPLFLGCGFLIHLSTGQIALDSEPRGRRYVKNTGHNKNRLYSRAILCPAIMEKHYIQWFILKSVQDIMGCKKIRFCLLESRRTKPWCPGLVSRPSAKAQEPLERSSGLIIQPQKLLVAEYFELSFLGCGFLINLSNRYNSAQFRAPWKKIHQKYDIQQQLSLFKGHWFLCFGTRPKHQTRAPSFGPPRLKKGKSNFLHNP